MKLGHGLDWVLSGLMCLVSCHHKPFKEKTAGCCSAQLGRVCSAKVITCFAWGQPYHHNQALIVLGLSYHWTFDFEPERLSNGGSYVVNSARELRFDWLSFCLFGSSDSDWLIWLLSSDWLICLLTSFFWLAEFLILVVWSYYRNGLIWIDTLSWLVKFGTCFWVVDLITHFWLAELVTPLWLVGLVCVFLYQRIQKVKGARWEGARWGFSAWSIVENQK